MTSALQKNRPGAAFPFDNSYVALPPHFFAAQAPTAVAEPWLIKLNEALAAELGLNVEALRRDGAAIFSGNLVPEGAEPLAMAYAGHQFGGFSPQLGDGRAILLGEVVDRSGKRYDIQLKGAGPTPFSRRGDGRAAIGPVLREYIISEAMFALGVPATRALAAVTTGEPVYREEVLPGAVFTRVAASHIRVGTFQYFAARGDTDGVRALADYVIDRHYPALKEAENPYLALFEAVCERQAALIARWLHVGFIHGVMNTDNMTVSGETIDFGPCAFMDTYDPATVFSSIDQHGRYAYANQPGIGQWNLARLGETLLPLIDADPDSAVDKANAMIKSYGERFQAYWLAGMREKIGLAGEEDGDLELVQALLSLMQVQGADFTLAFRRLSDLADDDAAAPEFAASFREPEACGTWLMQWRERLSRDAQTATERTIAMRSVNPAFIPRNHRVEQVIKAAVEDGDFSLFEALLSVLSKPYEDQPGFAAYREPPKPDERVLATFCGT
ncbi:protein adenylyltransferase SelO [Rhizobium leguminosarum]|uniref:protein adenylyltransferase SelO n=1 Tax=Rhizobium leguminosarum TaxID=384 RepID=UPI001030F0EA|nr:YdiU family protein [Rhizobium leguminosarum]TAU82738.1 YdiU family protein [Rhizobium leguminosarum]TAX08920.1 YdiU family protein [Rhizobium leguminosarum]TAY11183.1 YdiU family protein [Rhizobium leguminosarum]TAZ13500.1 YdiU family protein [Rhizobium leguminosarum]